MRSLHGGLPRNPFNMTIQENHVADKATYIISFKRLKTNYMFKHIKYAIHRVNQHIRENAAEY